eukprot:12880475-Prorocentrum_lima.AAC.1
MESLTTQSDSGFPVSWIQTSTTKPTKSTTSHVAFNCVVLGAPNVSASPWEGSGSAAHVNFLGDPFVTRVP